jgi:hypothetical protein
MNSDEARAILLLYRPGTDDDRDPEVLEAMRAAENDSELAQWFQAQRELTVALRAKLKSAEVPPGLKEQIFSERKARGITRPLTPRRLTVPTLAFALFLALGLVALLYFRSPSEDLQASFRDSMVPIALRMYPKMDLETSDLSRIRQFLTDKQAYGDYVLPPALEKAKGTGCAILRPWHGRQVSMVCFSSGASPKADLFLFIVDRSVVPNAPPATSPNFTQLSSGSTLCWSDADKTYLLVGEGDKQFLQRFY